MYSNTCVNRTRVCIFYAYTKYTQTKCPLAACRGNKLEHNTSGKKSESNHNTTYMHDYIGILIYIFFFLLMLEERVNLWPYNKFFCLNCWSHSCINHVNKFFAIDIIVNAHNSFQRSNSQILGQNGNIYVRLYCSMIPLT